MSKLTDFLEENNLIGEEWLWKTNAAKAIGKDTKTLERRVKEGLITQKTKGTKAYYKIADLLEYEKTLDTEIMNPTVIKDEVRQTKSDRLSQTKSDSQTLTQTEIIKPELLTVFVAENLGKFADAMNSYNPNSQSQLQPPPVEKKSQFLTIEEAAAETRLSPIEIKRLIESEILHSYKGERGKKLVSRKELESL